MANTDSIKFAGDVNVGKIEIIASNGFFQDVTNQVKVIEIYEDIFAPFISGTLTFRDSLDLPNLFPFIGEEYVNIKINTPTFEDKTQIIDDQFFLFRMSDKSKMGDRNMIYQLGFISKEALVDMNKKVSKAYSGKPNEIALKVIKDSYDGLESKKKVNIDNAINKTKFVSNYWSPIKIINYAVDNAVNDNGVSDFLFYENRYGLNFVSLETLSQQTVYQDFINDMFMREDRSDGTTIRDVNKEYKRIVDMNTPVVYDYLDRSQSGMFASKLIAHDITTKRYSVKTFDMLQNFDGTKRLNPNPLISLKNVRRFNSLIVNYPKYYGNFDGYTDVTNSKTLQSRISRLKQIRAQSTSIAVPGRTDYTVGQKIYLKMNKFSPSTKKDTKGDILDKIMSGNYIIAAINHYITREKHECHMEIIKDSLVMDANLGGDQ